MAWAGVVFQGARTRGRLALLELAGPGGDGGEPRERAPGAYCKRTKQEGRVEACALARLALKLSKVSEQVELPLKFRIHEVLHGRGQPRREAPRSRRRRELAEAPRCLRFEKGLMHDEAHKNVLVKKCSTLVLLPKAI